MMTMPTSPNETVTADQSQADLATRRSGGKPAAIDLRRAVCEAVVPRLRAALVEALDAPPHPLIAGAGDRRAVTRSSDPHLSCAHRLSTIADADVCGLVADLLADDQSGANRRVDALRLRGLALEAILVDLLAPAACRLHALWQDDLCGLAEMALAFCALKGLLRHHATEFRAEGGQAETGFRALLALPSQTGVDVELSVFGLMLTSEFFRRAGWDARSERDLTSGVFRDTVRGWFDLVEVLATSDKQLDAIAAGIRVIRRDSPNPAISVIVCGQVFAEHPEFVGMVGADTMVADPFASLAQAEMLVQAQLVGRHRAIERARTAGQVRTLERLLVQPRTSRRMLASAADAVPVSCVGAHSYPTNPSLRPRLS